MPLYWSSRQIPALARYNARERTEILQLAMQKLRPPQKLVINLAKLLVLIPPFMLAARLANWTSVLVLLLTAVLYPLITRPLGLYLASQHLEKAIKRWQQEAASR